MADEDDVTVFVLNGQPSELRGLSDDQRAGRACIHCGRADGSMMSFGMIGEHAGALHEWCLGKWRGEFKGRR